MTSTAELSSPSSANSPLIGALDHDYTLDHKYTRTDGRIYLSGVQALVRLPLMQRLRDQAAGLNTGRLHLAAIAARRWAASTWSCGGRRSTSRPQREVHSRASTRTWARPWSGARSRPTCSPAPRSMACFDVVRQGPGRGPLRRRVQARQRRRHLEARRRAGAGRRRPRLPLFDPAARFAKHEFVSAMMPVLNPAGVQDILDMGLLGWAMCRFTGRWVGFKTIAETVESSASVDVNPFARRIVLPDRLRDAGRRPQHPLARSAAGPGNAPAPLRGEGRAGVRARQPHRPHRASIRRARAWASSPPARATSTCCRRWNTSASTNAPAPTSASASTRSA